MFKRIIQIFRSIPTVIGVSSLLLSGIIFGVLDTTNLMRLARTRFVNSNWVPVRMSPITSFVESVNPGWFTVVAILLLFFWSALKAYLGMVVVEGCVKYFYNRISFRVDRFSFRLFARPPTLALDTVL